MVADETPELNVALWLHSTVYAGLLRPDPPSDELVHVHVGRWLLVGDVVVGAPGVVGAAVSITNVTVEDHAETFPRTSLARKRTYHMPSVRLDVV